MAHAASQLKKRADENLNAAEDEKEKKKLRKRSREVKKKVEDEKGVWEDERVEGWGVKKWGKEMKEGRRA